jgi:hypothetical protein
MSFSTSTTYIYAYIAFASVYVVTSFTFVASALRVSTGLSRAHQAVPSAESPSATSAGGATAVLEHGQKAVDYTQLATLLPLVYIVGSLFLGSVIARDTSVARLVNIGWIVFTVLCAVASVGLAVLGIRESGAISRTPTLAEDLAGRASDALQRIGTRLGVSAALLLLVTVFTLLNLWSIVSGLGVLSGVDFLL